MSRSLAPFLEQLHCLPRRDPQWNWRHGDLALREWYRGQGRLLAFDAVAVVEWDLLLLDALPRLYAAVPQGALGLSRLRPVSQAQDGWRWVAREPYRGEWLRLMEEVRARHGYAAEPLACIAGGALLPRGYLEACAGIEIPELGNDEIRLPLYAQILGFPVVDAGLYRPGEEERAFFSLGGPDIDEDLILEELARRGGRRVFHPVRRRVLRLTGGGTVRHLLHGISGRLRKVARGALGRAVRRKA